eukprot:CAMPEP_0174859230 /NCGR_PEP_ID=MMETSP1114-20130205/45829_1 /TAXON_ID=312471 /ORGANISM="Neobodo designis, Strain CCAP 1951/1" /LENGTH=48 /DNA_ID= /DNA_START= /DNA_END= /DNA_ORIENTATION=
MTPTGFVRTGFSVLGSKRNANDTNFPDASSSTNVGTSALRERVPLAPN